MNATPAGGGRWRAQGPILVFLTGALLYVNVLTGPFLYDDVTEILANPTVHRLSAIPGLVFGEFWAGLPGWPSLHRPVTAATIPLLFVLGDGASWPFHLANLVLHGLVCGLLAAIVARLTSRTIPALVAGLLFAAHPIHTEAVAWISGRSELLFAAFGAAAWWCHLRAREGRHAGWPAGAALLLVLALGSKETAICWPPIIAAGDFLFPAAGATRARSLRLHAVYWTASAAWLAWRYGALGHLGRRPFEGLALSNPLVDLSWWPESVFTSLRLTSLAAVKGVWPGPACIDYGFDQVPVVADPLHADVALAAAGLAALVLWGARVAARRAVAGIASRLLLLGIAVAFFSWLPVSSAVVPSIVIFAERNLYLPVFGWCLAAGVIAEALVLRLPARRAALAVAGAALLAPPVALTLSRAALFNDQLAVFSSSATTCDRSANAQMLHAGALEEAGRDEEASAALRRALAIAPHHADARVALAGILVRAGRTEEALVEVRAALEEEKLSLETRLAAVGALHAAGREEEADALLSDVAREAPDDQRVLFTRGRALLARGDVLEALEVFERLGSLHAGSPYGLDGAGAALLMLRRHDEAEAAFLDALGLDPYDTNALFNLGLLKLGRGVDDDQAEKWAVEAADLLVRYLRLMPSDARGWAHLARARETAGDLRGSREALRQAVGRAPDDDAVRRALDEFLSRHPDLTEPARD